MFKFSEVPGGLRVAPLASREIITTKSPLPVVTRHATKSARRSMVIKRLWRCYLIWPRRAGSNPMTFVASQSFRLIVLCMAEAEAECRSCFARANITTGFVAHSAGRNIPIARPGAWAVALVTSDMRIYSGRNRHGHTAGAGAMTSDTANTAHFEVTRMIESHTEAFETRKWLQRSRLDVAVADRAYRISRISKLLYMTTGARQVVRISGHRRPG